MNKKVEQYAKGNIEMNQAEIILSETEIHLLVEAGNKYFGSFSITNDKKKPMKGILFSTSRLLHVTEEQFVGVENIIHFEIDATSKEAGTTINGSIDIISDCGERKINVFATVATQVIHSLGKQIATIDEWIDLAKTNWNVARDVFVGEQFETVLLRDVNEQHQFIYRGLKQSNSVDQAMEEFMIAIHKKQAIQYEVSKHSLCYENVYDSFVEQISITKDVWGYTKLKLSSDVPFLQIKKEVLTDSDFIGNQATVEVMIMADHLRDGKNYGTLLLETLTGSETIEVVIDQKKEKSQDMIQRFKIKEWNQLLIQNYLEFRLGHRLIEEYIEQAREVLNHLMMVEEDDRYQLLNIHLHIVSHEELKAREMLERYQGRLAQLKEENPLVYGGISYLTAMLYKDEASIMISCDAIKEVYKKHMDNYWLFWFLIYLDKQYYNQPKLLLEDLIEVLGTGVTSPVLYFEAMNIYISNPSYLHSLGKEQIRILYFGMKHDMITFDLANQIAYLAVKERYYNRLLFLVLKSLYHKYQSKDILTAICSILIKGHMRKQEHFYWYRLGVEAQLRVTELHEYYMYTIDENSNEPLPQQILLYFIYNSSLSDKKRAYLYARIVKEKDSNASIYRTYAKKIEQFAKRQLAKRNINDNLAILYQCVLEENAWNEDELDHLFYVAQKVEIVCDNPKICGVMVEQREIDAKEYIPMSEGRCQVNLLSDDAGIYLVDESSNLYCSSIPYKAHRILPWNHKLQELLLYTEVGMYNQIALVCKPYAYRTFEEHTVELCNRLLEIPNLRKEYAMRIMEQLICYFDSKHAGERMEPYVQMIPMDRIQQEKRTELVEMCIRQESYETAMKVIRIYGYETISVSRLTRLCLHLIYTGQNEELLMEMCIHLFEQGCEETGIIEYLVAHYVGPTKLMYRVWECAMKLTITASSFEEQILSQVLFAEHDLDDVCKLVVRQIQYHGIKLLTRACLNKLAADYIVRGKALREEYLVPIKQEVSLSFNPIVTVAYLLYVREHKDKIKDEDKRLICSLLEIMVEKELVLPEFKELSEVVELPEAMKCRTYVSYRKNTDGQVRLHYRIYSNEIKPSEFKSEALTPAILGICSKSFLLFYQEELEYYFTIENGQEIERTELHHIRHQEPVKLGEEKYDELNQMLYLFEKNDTDQLANMIEAYMKRDFIINHYFKMI